MINFKDIVESAGADKLKNLVVVDGNPVWDYKSSKDSVFLISDDTWEGIEDEYVSVKELKKYIVNCEIPFDRVVLIKEETKEVILEYKWNDCTLDLTVDKLWTKNNS
jgi:uncharacterized protein (UPF0248 family)